MEESILDSVKQVIGISTDDTDFDPQIIMHINTVLFTLNQIGSGNIGFKITGRSEKWSDLYDDEDQDIHAIQTYVALQTWVLFDSSGITSGTMSAIKEQIKELEWRINIERESLEED